MITSTAQANEVALKLLKEVALVEESLEAPQMPNPALEPGDAIAITEPTTRTSGRYLVEQVNLPLHLGVQTLGAKVARSV